MKHVAIALVMLLTSAVSVDANLYNRGTDSLGNRLIYDDDLNITWYDFTQSINTWQSQVNWADALSVNFGGTNYTDWRLPTALNQDGSGPCVDFNCTGSELGHLYYTELGNVAQGGLVNKGNFLNLKPSSYGTNYHSTSTDTVIYFAMFAGFQEYISDNNPNISAIAVRVGDVIVPEPISSILFLTGAATLGFRRFRNKFKK